MKKVQLKDGYLYYKDTKTTKRCPYSENALKVLESRGYNLKSLLTLDGKLSRPLYHYQLTAVNLAEKNGWNLLLADSMGTGKSNQAIACMVRSKSKKTLIIVPANIKYQWERNLKNEIVKCPHIYVGNGQDYELKDMVMMSKSKIVIMNYDIVNYWEELLLQFEWDLMILDESQKIKKNDANRTKTIKKLKEKGNVKSCICLSGTPLTDRNADIYNSVWLVNPHLFGSQFAFEQRYCTNTNSMYDSRSVSVNTLELNRKLIESGTMLRRTKKDVYKEIPKVSLNIVPMRVGTETLHELELNAKADQRLYAQSYGQNRGKCAIRFQATLEHYLQEAIRLKLPSTIRWIENFLEETEEKLIVACVHRDKCGNILHNYFSKISVLVDGSLTAKKKDQALTEFINDPEKKLLIGNIQSISAGIDGLQTVCSHMVVAELCWSPADLHQLFARLDRNGQTDPVSVHIHVVEDSLDDMMARMLDKKSNILSEVLDGKSLQKEDMLSSMIEKAIK